MKRLILLGLLLATPAFAHARLVSSDPAASARIKAPGQIKLQFSENLEPAFSSASLIDSAGKTRSDVVVTAVDQTVTLTLPDTLLFFTHAAGPLIQNAVLKAAMDAADPDAAVPYIDAADRFGVSRTHVRNLMADAESAGLVRITGRGGRQALETCCIANLIGDGDVDGFTRDKPGRLRRRTRARHDPPGEVA